MTKTGIVMIFIWIALAIAHIVSLFVACKFLFWCGIVFGCFNFTVIIALIPEIIKTIKEFRRV